mgnify:CR=1 FL=1
MQVINRTTKAVFNLDPQQAETLIENFDFIESKNHQEAAKKTTAVLNPEEMKILGLETALPVKKKAGAAKSKKGGRK